MLAALLYGEFKEMFPNNGEQRITAAPLESGLGGNRTRAMSQKADKKEVSGYHLKSVLKSVLKRYLIRNAN